MLRDLKRSKRLLVTTATTALLFLGTGFGCESSLARPASVSLPSVKRWPCVKGKQYLRDTRGLPVWLSSEELMQRVLEKQPVPRPSLLGKSRLRGDVIVQVLINEYGKVDCIRAIKGHPLAISSAVVCVSKWTFKPYSGNGQLTKCILGTLIIPYDFGR